MGCYGDVISCIVFVSDYNACIYIYMGVDELVNYNYNISYCYH